MEAEIKTGILLPSFARATLSKPDTDPPRFRISRRTSFAAASLP
jgi:hypothetical protein